MTNAMTIDIGTPSPERLVKPSGLKSDDAFAAPSEVATGAALNGTTIPYPHPSSNVDNSGGDLLEEIDDPSEMLSRPLKRISPPLPLPDETKRHRKRMLPPEYGNGSSTETGQSLPSAVFNGNTATRLSRIWQPPTQSPFGQGVKGSRPDSQPSEPRPFPGPTAADPAGSHGTVSMQPQVARKSPQRPAAIDLTGDDDCDDPLPVEAGPSRGAASQGKSKQAEAFVVDDDDNVVDDDDDDDEPILVSSRSANTGDIVLDEQRNNAIVCIGMITSVVLCMYGLPQELTNAGDMTAEPPADPAYDRSNWPNVTSFWSQRGYRPLMLSLSNPNANGPGGRALTNGWNQSKPPARPADVKVSVVTPPLLAHPGLPPEEAKKRGPGALAPFGSLAEKYVVAMEPLLRNNKIRCEARCRQVSTARAGSFLHSIEILVFARRPEVALVSEKMSSHGIQLDHPTTYRPEEYPTSPEYSNPHNPPAGGYRNDARSTYSGIYRGTAMGTTVQTREATEKQKKEQVDAIYSSITSGEELPTVEPKPIIKTKLFQHQKQALSFLLERERARHWTDLKKPAAGATGAADDIVDVDASPPAKHAMSERREKDQESLSLWKVKWDSRGKARTFTHLITQREAKKVPNVCRGAILADDMGLGKTITTIALIAHTAEEADKFGDSELDSYPVVDPDVDLNGTARQRRVSIEDVSPEDDSPPPAKKARSNKAPKRKVSKSKKDPEAVRQANLERRSRATLIVCPLSVVANWEEQIKEHWDKSDPPRIYVYHGNSRITDTAILSNFDIVLTTYPTLGHEFSNQKTWLDEMSRTDKSAGEGKGGGAQDDNDDDDDGEAVVMVNKNGIPIETQEKKKKKKRKKIIDGKESPNALQRIEWFRVVLDEAHFIKGALTWQSKAVCNLSAQRRLCLTGTPIQNSTDDLFALLRFLRLDPFTDRATWNEFCGHKDNSPALRRSKYAKDADELLDSSRLGHIQIIMKFLALRRTKDMKASDGTSILKLPPRLSLKTELDFDESEKARYHALHSRYKEDFEEMLRDDSVNHNYATILHEILNLRLACDHPSLVDASKDAKRRLAGSNNDPGAAIEQDGLSRERAADLFSLFRDSGMAFCSECQADLSAPMAERDGLAASGGVDALDDALQAAVIDQDRNGKRKVKSSRATGTTATSTGLQTPASFGDSAATPAIIVRPVVTRCQHIFCSPCFKRHVGDAWPRPKLTDANTCPTCQAGLKLAIDALQLEPSDFAEIPDSDDEGGGADARGVKGSDESDSDSSFDWRDDEDDDQRYIVKRKVRVFVPDDEESSNTEDEYKPKSSRARPSNLDSAPPSTKKPRSGGKQQGDDDLKPRSRKYQGDVSLQNRPDLSTKIRALLEDLVPFSQCNPRSALYDPDAPILEHVDPSTLQDEEILKSKDPVVIHQRPRGQIEDYEPIKSVVFSQWTKMLDRIAKSLKLTGIRFTRLDGSMRRQERNVALERFKNDAGVEVLLISLRAGGTGLNLTAANRAYLMDPFWNPAVENQGLDRIHRLGQRRPVVTIKYVMKDSIELNMIELQERKMKLANKIGERRQIGDEGSSRAAATTAAGDRKAERREELSLLFR